MDAKLSNINYICFIDILIKILMLFSLGFFDLTNYPYIFQFMQSHPNLYLDQSYPNYLYNYYPAFFFEFQYLWFRICGDSIFSLRLLLNLADFGCFWMIYLIGKLKKNEKLGCIFAFAYIIFPLKFFALLEGKNDFIALFFELCGIYFYLLKKYPLSGMFFGLAINFKLFPVFALIPIFIFFWKEKNYRNLMVYITIILFFTILTSIRFLLLDPNAYIDAILINSSRPGDGLNFSYFLLDFRKQYHLEFYNFLITFSVLFIYEILGLLSLIGLIYFNKPFKFNFFSANTLIFMCLPIIFIRMDLNSWLWASPFLIITLFSNNYKFLKFNMPKVMIIFIVFLITAIISIVTKPNNFQIIFQPYTNEYEIYHISIFFNRIDGKRAFGVYYYVFLLISGSLTVLVFHKDSRFKQLGYITLFHCYDAFNYFILEYNQYNFTNTLIGWILFFVRNTIIIYLIYYTRKITKILHINDPETEVINNDPETEVINNNSRL